MDILIPMGELFTAQNAFTLLMLMLLQAVLGFDNLLYISMESKRVEADKQAYVRKVGLIIAIVLRIALLFILVSAIDYFQDPFFELDLGSVMHVSMTGHALIVLLGGGFICYTAVKEIFHMLAPHDLEKDGSDTSRRSIGAAIFYIVLMNLVFSFDSILSAVALTKVFLVMAAAIVFSGVLMIWSANWVSEFLKRNRMYEVLGLFILLLVGVMLLSEGGHLAHLAFFGYPIEPMAKSTFYFVIVVLFIVDLVQSKYQTQLMASKEGGSADADP